MVERDAERKIHILLTQNMHRRLRIRCTELDVTIQDYVVRMLDQALAHEAGHEDEARARPEERRRCNDIPEEYYGWWRITETGTWVDDGLDDLGPAMISFTGDDDRLRMHCLLANVNAQGTKGSRKNNFAFSHPGFRPSSPAPQSRILDVGIATPADSLNRREQI